MLSKAQKNWMIAIGIVSLVLGLIVALPFRSIPGLNNGENIFVVESVLKLILGVVAILLAIYPAIKKYQQLYNYREVSKLTLVMAYFPIVIYIIATIINIIQTLSFDYVSAGVGSVLSEKIFIFSLHCITFNRMRDQQYKLSRRCPRCSRAWGRAARSGSRYENFQTYLWDSVCSAGVSFCFLKSMFWKDFLLEGFF